MPLRPLRRRRLRAPIAVAGLALLLLAVAGRAADEHVTAASGPSLIAKLKTGVDWTAFGRSGGSGPAPEVSARWLVEGFEVDGADLYRINCRSCHGAEGTGARSGIPPLSGAFAAGAPGEPAGEIRVRHRLVDGGRVMPNFAHLQADEVALLLGHLKTLAGEKPAATRPLRVSTARLGEHVVKANCQVCHDATPGVARPAADATVLPIAQFTSRFSAAELVRKVRQGSAGDAATTLRRMPRIDYLAAEEIEAAYVYLVGFPPHAAEADKP